MIRVRKELNMTTLETITELLNLNGCRFDSTYLDTETIVVECADVIDSRLCASALLNGDLLDVDIWVNSQFVEVTYTEVA